MKLKTAVPYLAILIAVLAGFAVADVTHFTETLPPATSAGATPVSNGYDWSLSNGSNAPSSSFKGITNTGTLTQTGAVTQSGGAVTQSTTTMTGGFAPMQVTAATELTLTPTTTGQWIYCTNCANAGSQKGIPCISTGVVVGSFVTVSTNTAVTACQ